jgi:hypothetical protein
MAKKKAPAKLTGGAGFCYEDCIAARFLLDLLGGTNTLGHDFGRVTRVDWQARDAGWLADDLVISCKLPNGDRAAGISIKSDRQVTKSGFPEDFIKICWAQWLGKGTARRLREDIAAICLITGRLAQDVETAWSKTLSEALQTTSERMIARLSMPGKDKDSQASAIQRQLFASFRCPAALFESDGIDESETVQLLRHIRVFHLDYETPTSRHRVQAVNDCQNILHSGDAEEALALWNRLIGFAAQKRAGGGSSDLAELLTALRGSFDFRDHPDYRRDWEALDHHSQAMMEDVRTEIPGLPRLLRDAERGAIEQTLNSKGVCFLVGESGSGKSALAKETGHARYPRVVWAGAETVEHDYLAQIERALSIRYPLIEVLAASSQASLVVFDGVEGYSGRALRHVARIIRDLRAGSCTNHVHVLITLQFEASRRTMTRLAEEGVPIGLLEATQIHRPSEDGLRDLVATLPELRWTTLRAEIRPLLTNLKILDWVVRVVRSGRSIDDRSIIGLTTLIDALWDRWIEGDDNGLGKSHLLMRVVTFEAETLSAGVPRMRLEYGEQQTLPALVASDLIRISDQRVRFSHDLLGDWARMMVLVGEPPTDSPANRDRAASPRWHRAVRLYGQRLLEQTPHDCERWRLTVEQTEDGSDSGKVVRDLLLESLFLAINAGELLNRVWSVLTSDTGRLLNRLLDRFLFVATLPDPRLAEIAETAEAAARLEHAFRIPFWPYWGSVLTILCARCEEVVRLAPLTTARVCCLWLRTMPTELDHGRPMPWRQEAATLAVAIAREFQARNAEGTFLGGHDHQVVYEAALYAAPDTPDEVASLCLELAQRRDPSPQIQTRANQARLAREEESRRFRQANPQRARKQPVPGSLMFLGPLREPWPDGPRARVEDVFRDACLDSGAFPALVKVRPEAAQEVLLAVSIEEPQHERPFSYPMDDNFGVDHWQKGYPPLYFRGPFLAFLRDAPQQGLSFVLRLVNFATHRFVEQMQRPEHLRASASEAYPGVTVSVDEQPRKWLGDYQVFRWHNGWPHSSRVIPSALMALERWLYEQLEGGASIEPSLARILAESESVAFAGLLLDIGKRQPTLFEGPLRPLLRVWELYELDSAATLERATMGAGLISWGMQSAKLIELAREWYGLTHRRFLFRDVAVRIMLGREELRSFFDELRIDWTARHDAQGEPESLRLLIERLNPANYSIKPHGEGQFLIHFQWPEAIERMIAESQRHSDGQMRLLSLPMKCRQRLDAGTPLEQRELDPFWEALHAIDAERPPAPTESGYSLMRIEDALCAGIAVLFVFHQDWLEAVPKRMTWCRETVETIAHQPPPWSTLDHPVSVGNLHWDAFLAECGVALLAKNRDDPLARFLVSVSVIAYHYETTALTMKRASARRPTLQEDFDRMVSLALRSAGLRTLFARARQLQIEAESIRWQGEQVSLTKAFRDRSLPVERPTLQDINDNTLQALEDLHHQRFPEQPVGLDRRRRPRHSRGPRETLQPAMVGIDLRLIMFALSWLDLGSAGSGEERHKWLDLIRELLHLSLARLPAVEDPRVQDIDGLPDDFDNWVDGLIARAIPRMTSQEDPDSLWRPIVDLGTPAHHWVERFIWEWFSGGVNAAKSPQDFTATWARMIRYALTHPRCDPATNRRYDLGEMVSELLGFGIHGWTVTKDDRFIGAVGEMTDTIELAARRWFVLPHVVSGFASFAVRPAAAQLLIPGVIWVSDAVRIFNNLNWKDFHLEEHLVEYLQACWERGATRVSGNPQIRAAFLDLLTRLSSRGGHAAIALRDRVLDSIAS